MPETDAERLARDINREFDEAAAMRREVPPGSERQRTERAEAIASEVAEFACESKARMPNPERGSRR